MNNELIKHVTNAGLRNVFSVNGPLLIKIRTYSSTFLYIYDCQSLTGHFLLTTSEVELPFRLYK